MSDEVSLLLATCKGDPAGFESVISAGALPFALIVDFLVHVDSWERHMTPASQHVPTLWHGILKGCERTLQKAPYGHVLAQPLLLSLCQLASTGHCTPLVPLQSLLKGSQAALASLPIGQVWSLYTSLWPREVLWASGLAQAEGTNKKSLTEQTEEALGTLDFEERLALDSLQSLVAVLQGYSSTGVGSHGETKTKALPTHAKLDAGAAHKLYLQAASMCCRCVRLGAEECVLLARASLGLDSVPDASGIANSTVAGVEHSAASKSQKKRQKRKEKEKSAKAPAAGGAPAPAPVARPQPLLLDLVPISGAEGTLAGRVQQVYSALAASKTGAATKVLMTPVDGLFAYLLGLSPSTSQDKARTVKEQEQQQRQVPDWVEAWAAATKACLLEDRLAQVSVAHGAFVSSSSPAGEGVVSAGLGDFLASATAQRSALTPVPTSALSTTSLRAVHAAAAARFAVGLAALHPSSGQGFGLPTTAVEASIQVLADKHKLTLTLHDQPGSTATPSLSALELEAIDQDASLAEELNDEEQAWVESIVPSLMPTEPKGPAPEGVVRQYVRLAAGLAAAYADSGDIDAARQAHRSCFWWLAEHVLAPIHAAAGEGEKAGGAALGDGVYRACVEQCLHAWAAFEEAHGMSAEELDFPLLHLQDLRRSGASQAARQIALSYAEAARCAAVEVLRACKRAVLVHAKERERAADTAAAATIAAVQRAKEANKEREAKQAEERAKKEAEQAKASTSKGGGGGSKGKGDKKAFAAVPATAAATAAPASQPPPPPSMASLKAQTDAPAAPSVPAQPSLDMQAVLARVQAAARAGGQLGFLPQAGFPPIPDLDD